LPAGMGVNIIWVHMPAAGAAVALLLILTRKNTKRADMPKGSALAFAVQRNAEEASAASAAIADFCEEYEIDRKKSMLLSMAVEEMITLIAQQNAEGGDISVRLTRFDNDIVLRLRDTGKKFNPIEWYAKRMETIEDFEDSVSLMGVKYITEAADVVHYRETFGVNNLVVIL